MKRALLELDKQELCAELKAFGQPMFRTEQIRQWVFARKTTEFAAMTNLSLDLRTQLAEKYEIFCGKVITHKKSADRTEKLLIEWSDGHRVECVLLRDDRNHRTACISSQVGCAMGCLFCAGGLDGFVRNLTRGEILEQILRLNQLLHKPERLTHLVIMGTGEPLLNLSALLPALDEVTANDSLDLSKRRVTISTVGIPQGIHQLADTGATYRLAVSLHAPNDALRNTIVPQNRHSGIANIMAAADRFFHATGRRVTFEYVLIDQVNDRPEHARELVQLLKNRTAIVNLIPLNPVAELPYRTPSQTTVQRFVEQLEQGGIDVKTRYKKGDPIDAACGQLRRSFRTP
ncbi:MAG: 23S rRNA (adenine(2503)-C(2))-methyltransferase RlmN [Planctomycetaceae bacterium]|nr:23S rRNA (adenine(2503)-C(2))-methyltransferase RlmN [Planctomycetaceae bacterium]